MGNEICCPGNFIITGLSSAGKTTVVYKLRLGEVETEVPCIGLSVQKARNARTTVTFFDIGGSLKIPNRLYHPYLENCTAVIFVVDSAERNDNELYGDTWSARLEIKKFLGLRPDLFGSSSSSESRKVLIFANKQDLPFARPVEELTEKLRLKELTMPWRIQPCCATTGEGLAEGFQWLASK